MLSLFFNIISCSLYEFHRNGQKAFIKMNPARILHVMLLISSCMLMATSNTTGKICSI